MRKGWPLVVACMSARISRRLSLAQCLELRRQRRVARRHAVVGGALEHGEVRGLSRRSPARPGCRSSRCRSCPTRLPVKSTPSCGHWPVWYHRALEVLEARDVGHVGGRQAADGGDQERARTASRRPRSRTRQQLGRLVVARAGDARVEADVALQVEPVGDVVEVAQDLGLLGIALRPVPLLLQLLREGIAVGSGSPNRSARRDSGSSTRCRRRRRRPPAPAPTGRAGRAAQCSW